MSFAQDIRPLFRPQDIEEMSWAYDLSSYDDVREHAEEIHVRLADGTMPCDGAWPEEKVDKQHIDILSARFVLQPQRFDVVVASNLFGDILSDLGAGIAGGLGLTASGNIHPGRVSMFEPVHGSAPDIAGQDRANPFAAVLTSALMLRHLGHAAPAAGDVAGREHVLEEVQRERLVEQRGARQSAALVGCEPIARQPRRAAPLRVPARLRPARHRQGPAHRDGARPRRRQRRGRHGPRAPALRPAVRGSPDAARAPEGRAPARGGRPEAQRGGPARGAGRGGLRER